MAEKNVVNQVVYKNEKSELVDYTDVGARFDDIVDSESNYSLKQFYDNYVDFMKNTRFVYAGNTQPKNNHVLLWIDTNE